MPVHEFENPRAGKFMPRRVGLAFAGSRRILVLGGDRDDPPEQREKSIAAATREVN